MTLIRCLVQSVAVAILFGGSTLAKSITAADEDFQVHGTKYVTQSETGLRFQRHREDVLQLPRKELGINPDKARNTSGIVIAFKTDSATIAARFRILAGFSPPTTWAPRSAYLRTAN